MGRLAGRFGSETSWQRRQLFRLIFAIAFAAVGLGSLGLSIAVASDYHGSITQGGSSVTVTLSTSGDKGYVTFSGTSGEQLGLGFTSNSFSFFTLTLNDPGGSAVYTKTVFSSTTDVSFPTLGSTGTYTIVIDSGTATGSVTLTLSDDLTDAITVGGSSKTVAISRQGENERLTFSGTAGENLGLGLTGSTMSGFIYLYRSTGAQVGGTLVFTANSDTSINWSNLPANDTYTIFVDPGSTTGSLTLTLSDDLTDSIAVGGASKTVTLSRTGQNERLTFSGTSGENLGLGITSSTMTGFAYLYRSNGAQVGGTAVFTSNSNRDINWSSLPANDTYTIFVDPGTTTGSVTLTLSDDVNGGSIAADVAPVTATIDRVGENERFTFQGSASEELNLGISEGTFSSGTVTIVAPDASQLLSSPFFSSDADFALPTLSQSGTYTVILDPGVNTGSATLTLTDPPLATNSVYMPSASLSAACQLGKTAAQAGPSQSAIILDWGRPAYDGTDLGTYLVGTSTFVSDGDILAATEEFVRCYYNNSSAGEQLIAAIGMNDYHLCPCGGLPPSYSNAGALWGSTANDLGDYIQTNGYSSVVSAGAADDAEPSWDTAYTTTSDFLNGYNSTASWIMLDYGSMESGYWSPSQEYHVAYGGLDFPFPQVYCEGNQTNWENLALWAAANEPPGMLFLGVLATYPYQIGQCTTFSPRTAYVKMLRALQSDSSTYQTKIGYLSNITPP